MPLPVMAFGEDALHRRSPEYIGNHFCCLTVCSLLWLAGFADSRGKVKNALYYSVVKELLEAESIAPSLFKPKS